MRLIKHLILILLILSIWQITFHMEFVSPYLLPSPVDILYSFLELINNGKLINNIYISVLRVLKGFSITLIISIPLAVLFHVIKGLSTYFNAVLNFVRNIPPLSAVPLLILWFGIGEGSKLAIIILASFFPVFLNCLSGLDSVDHKLIEMGQSIKLDKFQQIIHILIPESLPSFVTGITLGFGYSWRALIGAEMIAASKGLGYMILDAEELAKPDIVFVGIISIGILGIVFDSLGKLIIKKFIPWSGSLNG